MWKTSQNGTHRLGPTTVNKEERAKGINALLMERI